jgi:hypothetical protein
LLAVFGIVLELFVVEKELLTRGEHEFCSAIVALQDSVDEFHGRLPQSREGLIEIGHNMRACRSRFPVFDRP